MLAVAMWSMTLHLHKNTLCSLLTRLNPPHRVGGKPCMYQVALLTFATTLSAFGSWSAKNGIATMGLPWYIACSRCNSMYWMQNLLHLREACHLVSTQNMASLRLQEQTGKPHSGWHDAVLTQFMHLVCTTPHTYCLNQHGSRRP